MMHKLGISVLVILLAGCASKQTAIDDINQKPPTAAGDTELNAHVWTGINGKPVRALTRNPGFPQSPTSLERINALDFPDSKGDKYGQRIVGLLVPPETGDYRFWVSSDDAAEVWLSTDDSPFHRRLIAYNNKPTGYQVYTTFNTQSSAPIRLVAGERYFFEVLHKEYTEDDYLDVVWEGPGINLSAITETYLQPFGLSDQVSGETAYREGYHFGYTTGSLLADYDDTYPPVDSDADGLPDAYEVAIGNDPNDPTDALSDSDGDLLSAYEEYMLRSNPSDADTDGDGIPDGYETAYGLALLDPTDAVLDLDGDGVSNYDEYTAGSSPDDGADFPAGPAISPVSLAWQVPTSREDGSALPLSDISKYRIYAGSSAEGLQFFVDIMDPQQVTYTSEMVAGTYYFAISTITTDGLEGPLSSPVEVVVR